MYRELGDGKVDFSKLQSPGSEEYLVPAIVIDRRDLELGRLGCIRMVGFMNEAALQQTKVSGLVTFYSRTEQDQWTKGKISGNILKVLGIYVDCDSDTILVSVDATGPTCHTGTDSCFETDNDTIKGE